MDEDILRNAQEFAARWGFLTKDLFFNFFCPKSRAQQFRYWNGLVDKGLFVRSRANPEVLLLSLKSRAEFRESARPSRFHIFIDHDAVVAQVGLTLGRHNLVSRYWLEDELMRNPLDAYDILGASKVYRVPDLVFDLKTITGKVRCAIEIEKTVKPQSRYEKIALAYTDYQNVNLILFGCGSSAIETTIRRSFSGNSESSRRAVPGTFLFHEFDKMGLATQVRFAEKEMTFQNMLEVLTNRPIQNVNSKRDINEIAISFGNSKNSEVA